VRPKPLTLATLVWGLCLLGAHPRAIPSPPPSSISLELEAGEKTIEAWAAFSKEDLEKGLSGVLWLRENEGMIFVLPKNVKARFHMKGVTIPLSIAWLDRRGRILKIEDMDPEQPERIYEAPDRARYALEMNRGWFERNDIKAGDRVRRKS